VRKPNELTRFRRNPSFLLCLTGCRAASCGFEIIPSLVIAWIDSTSWENPHPTEVDPGILPQHQHFDTVRSVSQ
jgi:hypothetical protein